MTSPPDPGTILLHTDRSENTCHLLVVAGVSIRYEIIDEQEDFVIVLQEDGSIDYYSADYLSLTAHEIP